MLVTKASIILALGCLLSVASPAAASAVFDENDAPVGAAVSYAASPSETAPPAGLIDFCRREPRQCQTAGQSEGSFGKAVSYAGETYWRTLFAMRGSQAAGPSALTRRSPRHGLRRVVVGMTLDLGVRSDIRLAVGSPRWALVENVNRDINRSILQTGDERQYAVSDYWAIPSARPGWRARGDCEDFVLAKRAALIARGVPAAALSIALVTTAWNESHAVLLVATDKGDFVLDNLEDRVVHWSRTNLTWRSRQRPGDILRWIDLAGA